MILRRNHRRQNGECLAADVVSDRREKQRPDNPPAHAAGFLDRHTQVCRLCRRRNSVRLQIRLRNEITGAPSFAFFCEGWDTKAFDLRTLEPKHISLRLVVPTLRKKREGWGTRSFVTT